jgi:hypothetical protein
MIPAGVLSTCVAVFREKGIVVAPVVFVLQAGGTVALVSAHLYDWTILA